MAKRKPRSALRALFFPLGLAALGLVIALVMTGNYGVPQGTRSEYRALVAELDKDPIAERLRRESAQRCAPRGREYYWICGVVIEASPTLPYGYCSTPERPLYYGALDSASQMDLLGDLKFENVIRVSELSVAPTNSATPYAYPHVFPPKDILAQEPAMEPGIGGVSYSWVDHQGLPVLFSSGTRDWKLGSDERADLPVGVVFKHPDLPLRVVRSIPKTEIADWRHAVDTAISDVRNAVVAENADRTCTQPPQTVRFVFNTNNIGKLKALRDWVHVHHTP